MNNIEQVKFSESIKHFKLDFIKRWNIKFYHDKNKPCLFAGVYRDTDADAINNHKGFKVVWITGDVAAKGYRRVFKKIDLKNVIFVENDNAIIGSEIKKKRINIPIKDYSMFNPNKLGDKIYCYLGNDKAKHKLGFDFAEELRKRTKFDIIYGFLGNDIEHVKKEYYDKSFINLKTSITGGFTTANELAYMGRFTISNAVAPFCLNYKNINDVLKIIDRESRKIGTIQSSLIPDNYFVGEEWKQVEFWLK